MMMNYRYPAAILFVTTSLYGLPTTNSQTLYETMDACQDARVKLMTDAENCAVKHKRRRSCERLSVTNPPRNPHRLRWCQRSARTSDRPGAPGRTVQRVPVMVPADRVRSLRQGAHDFRDAHTRARCDATPRHHREDAPRRLRRQGRAGGADHRPRGRQQRASAAYRPAALDRCVGL